MWFHGSRPKWLYDALPYVYMASGLATLFVLQNAMAVFSGLMLVSAGATVWAMRRPGRNLDRQSLSASKRRAPADDGSASVKFAWRAEYACGHPVIDMQHRALLAAANAIVEAVRAQQSREDILHLLGKLSEDVDNHFRSEESILRKSSPALALEHAMSHRVLRVKASAAFAQYREGAAGDRDLISFLTHDIIAMHLANEDRKWFGRLNR